MFTRDDAHWLSETVGSFYSATNLTQLTAAGMAAVRRRFNLVAFTCEETSYDHSRYTLHAIHCETCIPSDPGAYIHDNPLGSLVSSGAIRTTVQLRRLASMPAWQRTDHYNGIARPVGFNDQLLILATDADRFYGVGIYRDTMFTEAEHALMALLQPHLDAAWHRAQTTPAHASDPHPARMLVSASFRILRSTGRHRELLRAYFPRWRESDTLPFELQDWVRASLARLREPAPDAPLFAFRTESARGRFTARCFPTTPNGPISLFFVEMPHVPDFLELRRAGLTTRECEVLHWIAQGKRDAEIGTILATTPKTVGKHVENLLRKLGAESRGMAVAAARVQLGN